MNRFSIGRLGVISLLGALLAAGCAFEHVVDEESEEMIGVDDTAHLTGAGDDRDHETSSASTKGLRHGSMVPKQADDACLGCGPVPDPWSNGPVPDPWSSSSGGSNSSSGGSTGGGSNSSSGGSNSSSGNN
ncbi:MAG: hypothetical protein KF850_06305 [Labilithrix sp.]|nr:hypothetical protein [Labilithrix sp.]